MQLGDIDASRNAQKLIAVRYFSTLANYAVGDLRREGGRSIPRSSPSRPGRSTRRNGRGSRRCGFAPQLCRSDERQPHHQRRHADRPAQQRRERDGDMATRLIGGLTVLIRRARSLGSNIAAVAGIPFPYAFQFTSSSAYTPLAADIFNFHQAIEADIVSDFQWGTPNAQPVTLSFWVVFQPDRKIRRRRSVNAAGTRSYPFTYAVPANAWTKIVITIPGDTGGPWVTNGNGGAMYCPLRSRLGRQLRGPANAWAAANSSA